MRREETRIGYVIGQLSYGGAERQLYELVRGVDPNRFRCFVYCLSERIFPFGHMIRESGAELRVLRRRGHFDIARILKLAALLRKDRIDILHSFLFLANGYACAARLLAGIPHLVTSARNCKGVGFLRGWANRCAFQMSDVVVCNGEAVRSFVVREYHAPIEKSVVICNGLDLRRFSAAPVLVDREVASRSQENRLVITVGRLAPQKDIELFLEAASLLARKTARVRFLIVGDGPCRGRLEQIASRIGLNEKVCFLGQRDDVPELIQTADVFWLTSAWEGLPNVLLEAMACAKPIVTRDVGACREVVGHGVNGYLVASRDAEKFAHYTLELLTNPLRAREMGEAGKTLAEEKFSVRIMVRDTEKLYGSLLDSQVGVAL